MRLLLLLWLVILIGLPAAFAAAPAAAPAAEWNGYPMVSFSLEGHPAQLVQPKTPAPGNPWIWRTEFFGHEPQGDLALLAAGWHVAYIKVSDLYGAPPAIEIMSRFHDQVVKDYGLSPRVVLEGFSRGGLYAVNYAAAHPEQTAELYLDAPVLDLRSWPGGQGRGKGDPKLWLQALALYGLTPETVHDFHGFPIDHAEALAHARVPIVAVCGDADDVVPFPENTGAFAKRYEAAGGTIKVILKPGIGHHPHSLPDPTPIVDFLLHEASFASP